MTTVVINGQVAMPGKSSTVLENTSLFIKDGIIQSIKNSLKKLSVDYIDLVLLHVPVKNMIKESWMVLEDILSGKIKELKGRIRFIGVSNHDINHLKMIIEGRKIKPFANQIEITPFYQRLELVKYCKNHNINIIAHTSLIRGLKFSNPIINKLAIKYKTYPALILLKWALELGYHVIPGTKNLEHLKYNLNVETINFKQEDLDKLNNIKESFHLFTY